MAGTVTVTENAPINGVTRIQFDWLSDASGDATKTTSNAHSGHVMWAVLEPDSGGTQPTALYDVTVTDSDGYDVLNGGGANCSNAANVYKAAEDKLGMVYSSTLSLTVAAAGNAKGGKVTLFIR